MDRRGLWGCRLAARTSAFQVDYRGSSPRSPAFQLAQFGKLPLACIMAENTVSVIARRVRDPSSRRDTRTVPGEFAWEFDFTHFPHGAKPEDEVLTVYLHLPGERGRWTPIWVRRGPPGDGHTWGWDGDMDRPTFLPSIHQPGVWHGYMTAGQLLSCGAARLPEPPPKHREPVTNAHPMLEFAQAPVPIAPRDPRRVGGWGS